MSNPERETRSAGKTAETLKLIVRLTPDGIRAAQERLAEMDRLIKSEAQRDLVALMEEVNAENAWASEDEVYADIEEAREAIWQRKQTRQAQG